MVDSNIPAVLLEHLKEIEPEATFTGNIPQIHSSSGKCYFGKSGRPDESEQYVGEAESLRAIGVAAPGLAPRVLAIGVSEGGRPYFISDYKDMGLLSGEAAKVLGTRLATELHAMKSPEGFGFGVPTYCGATRLANGWFKTWEECYSAMIEDLLTQLENKRGYYGDLINKAEEVRNTVIPKLLGPLVTQPVLLHGDLWSGNTGVDKLTGQPVIFDPASYYGHNEADLAIARIFGGFPESFFTTYHTHHPKTDPVDQYELRGDLYELFHYLNHTLIFGGGYVGSAMRKIDILLNAKL